MEKSILSLLLVFVVTFIAQAQTEISATEIVEKINQKENISYQNVVITGDLDLTRLDNMELDNRNTGDDVRYISLVNSGITFTNCIFKGKVLAYYNSQRNKTSYTTDFNEMVSFINCTFEEASSFRHTRFYKQVNFNQSQFQKEVNFRHTSFKEASIFQACQFEEEVDFRHTNFEDNLGFKDVVFMGEADFRHVDFPTYQDFSGTTFKGLANCRHTVFKKGVDFSNAQFLKEGDFRHAYFAKPINLENVLFEGEVDFKHANIDPAKDWRSN
ncbi:MAG: pentapeptide repeat-containing protein [Bacteroidota bacterium]